jgi:CspA family cold shock protein
MKKVKVQSVRYDMTKTKNRKRKDMLVDYQNESAVIEQLERIHKGERVVTIHEIVWDENQGPKDQSEWFVGTVKFFDLEKGFGFIEPEEEMDDLFFHKSACKDGVPSDKDLVEFQISEGPKGLTAIHVRIIESD